MGRYKHGEFSDRCNQKLSLKMSLLAPVRVAGGRLASVSASVTRTACTNSLNIPHLVTDSPMPAIDPGLSTQGDGEGSSCCSICPSNPGAHRLHQNPCHGLSQ